MKKITLKIAAIVMLSSVVFFACKKEKAAEVVDPCVSAQATIASQVTAYTNALTAYQADMTSKIKCNAVKTSLTEIIKAADTCPALASQVAAYKPLVGLYTCPN
jgi:hypothetical protein